MEKQPHLEFYCQYKGCNEINPNFTYANKHYCKKHLFKVAKGVDI